jgi:hypothetical protein
MNIIYISTTPNINTFFPLSRKIPIKIKGLLLNKWDYQLKGGFSMIKSLGRGEQWQEKTLSIEQGNSDVYIEQHLRQ